jgi:hypothetical protein
MPATRPDGAFDRGTERLSVVVVGSHDQPLEGWLGGKDEKRDFWSGGGICVGGNGCNSVGGAGP